MTVLDQQVSGHFVDVLDKLRRSIHHSSGISTMIDEARKVIDGFRLQSLYQGLEARLWNSRRNPNLSKLVDVALGGNSKN